MAYTLYKRKNPNVLHFKKSLLKLKRKLEKRISFRYLKDINVRHKFFGKRRLLNVTNNIPIVSNLFLTSRALTNIDNHIYDLNIQLNRFKLNNAALDFSSVFISKQILRDINLKLNDWFDDDVEEISTHIIGNFHNVNNNYENTTFFFSRKPKIVKKNCFFYYNRYLFKKFIKLLKRRFNSWYVLRKLRRKFLFNSFKRLLMNNHSLINIIHKLPNVFFKQFYFLLSHK
jgi:hypothetical protein